MRPRSAQGTFAWFIALIFFPLITIPLYVLLGGTHFHSYTKAIRDAITIVNTVPADSNGICSSLFFTLNNTS